MPALVALVGLGLSASAAAPQKAPILPPDLRPGGANQTFHAGGSYDLRLGVTNLSTGYRGPLEIGVLAFPPGRQPVYRLISLPNVYVPRGGWANTTVSGSTFPSIQCNMPVVVTADPRNRIAELNEDNNRRSDVLWRSEVTDFDDLKRSARVTVVQSAGSKVMSNGGTYTVRPGAAVLVFQFRSCAVYKRTFYLWVLHGDRHLVSQKRIEVPGKGGTGTARASANLQATSGRYDRLLVRASHGFNLNVRTTVLTARVRVQ